MATALTPLANITLGSSQTTVTFSSISQSYKDLILVIQPVGTTTMNVQLRFNGDTGANYVYATFYGNGSSTGSAGGSATYIQTTSFTAVNASNDNMGIYNIADFSTTDKHKVVFARHGRSSAGTSMTAGRWANTSAITSMSVIGGDFDAGTTMALYGVSA